MSFSVILIVQVVINDSRCLPVMFSDKGMHFSLSLQCFLDIILTTLTMIRTIYVFPKGWMNDVCLFVTKLESSGLSRSC